MIGSVPYETALDAASAVQAAVVAATGQRPNLVPYNHERPHDTVWWLAPGSELPAYRYGKLVFVITDDAPKRLSCGFNVERGLRPGPLVRRAAVLRDSWTWHRFIRDLTSPEMRTAVRSACESVGGRLVLQVLSHLAEPAPGVAGSQQLVMRFAVDADGRTERIGGTAGAPLWPDDARARFEAIESLTDVAGAITATDAQLHWFWLNVSLGHDFDLQPARTGEAGWAAQAAGHTLWNAYLCAWEPWLR